MKNRFCMTHLESVDIERDNLFMVVSFRFRFPTWSSAHRTFGWWRDDVREMLLFYSSLARLTIKGD